MRIETNAEFKSQMQNKKMMRKGPLAERGRPMTLECGTLLKPTGAMRNLNHKPEMEANHVYCST